MLFYDLFRQDSEFLEIKKGEYLFREGELGDSMYVLIEGEAGISIRGVLFESCELGSFVGEMAVIDGSPRFATVTATTDCKFAIINIKRFHFLVDETPGFAINVMKIIARRLRTCDQRVLRNL